jgi:predicted Zn-dependent protease
MLAFGLFRVRGLPRALLGLGLSLSLLAMPALAQQQPAAGTTQDGVQVQKKSRALALASAEEVEKQAAAQYEQLKRQAAQQRALAPDDHPQLQKLRSIASRIIPFTTRFNERAPNWRWEVNLIGSKQINAFCMPGGKIAFYTGIIDNLKLTDDEIAVIMGHEIAHALQEHGRERVGKERLAQGLTIGASVLSSIFGYGDLGGQVAGGAARLTLLKYSRDDETEADVVGLDIAARAGFDPRAGVVLWQKMAAASGGGQPPQFISTHPSHKTRIDEIRAQLKLTMPLYAAAIKKPLAGLPPYRSNFGEPVQ